MSLLVTKKLEMGTGEGQEVEEIPLLCGFGQVIWLSWVFTFRKWGPISQPTILRKFKEREKKEREKKVNHEKVSGDKSLQTELCV